MATGLQKLLVVLEGERFEEILAQPSLGLSSVIPFSSAFNQDYERQIF